MHITPRKQTGFGRPPRYRKRRDGLCANCGGENDRETITGKRQQRYCRACHAAYMRANRPKHRDLPPEARQRANARSYANVYLRRGLIERLPCHCGAPGEQMHHADYSKPLEVTWLCAHHHHEEHYGLPPS